ncbi:GIY-YIG nuclease family protein [Streptomyces albidoflavus]
MAASDVTTGPKSEPKIGRYRMLEVEQAPESPGLYAWYVSFNSSAQDWKTRPEGGIDAATEGYLNLLRQYAGYFEPLPITLRGSASYGGAWSGLLELDHGLSGTSEPSQSNDEAHASAQEKDREALSETISSQDGRRVLSLLLEQATPMFSSPLYIGVAENIRQRLEQHRKKYSQGIEWISSHPSRVDELHSRASNFGLRAAARGIAMEHLEAWVIDLGDVADDGVPAKKLRETSRSAEWLLHRLFTPILGRQ